MAKAKKGSTNSAPVEDNTPDVTAEVADAIASDSTSQEVDSTEHEIPVEIEVQDESTSSKEAVAAQAGNISVTAETSVEVIDKPVKKSPKQNPKTTEASGQKKNWWRTALIASGLVLTLLIFVAGGFSQLYKGKVLPSVSVAGVASSSKTQKELQKQIDTQVNNFEVTIKAGKTELKPNLKEIGYFVDTKKTAENALNAKREDLFSRFLFWQKKEVPAEISINNTLLAQYLDSRLPQLTSAGQDSRLEYDNTSGSFIITKHKDGTGPDAIDLKTQLSSTANNLKSKVFIAKSTKKPSHITEEKLQKLIEPANQLVSLSVVLQGSAGTFQAQPADIAAWITPTPQKDGSVELVVDDAKVQSYVESIGKQISSTPQDKKVIKDKKTGKQVVLQEGHDGTQLSDSTGLASQITQAVKNERDITLQMNIQTAKAKTISLEGYDKWIEVDLTKQTTTAYERATPIKTFIVATGVAGYDTPTGEYAIWLKVRSQTMVGGSKADGSYYNLANVEWVSYFYQDYALHGAWWRKVFGHPASHGCVNMTNEDAHWVYDWAPVGTKVIVHY